MRITKRHRLFTGRDHRQWKNRSLSASDRPIAETRQNRDHARARDRVDPQMVERFKSRLGDAVAVLHSGLSQGEKYDEWRKIERGEAQVVVGARSAILLR